MNSNLKSAGTAHTELARGLFRVAIVGAASLKGKEVAEMLNTSVAGASCPVILSGGVLAEVEGSYDEVSALSN